MKRKTFSFAQLVTELAVHNRWAGAAARVQVDAGTVYAGSHSDTTSG